MELVLIWEYVKKYNENDLKNEIIREIENL